MIKKEVEDAGTGKATEMKDFYAWRVQGQNTTVGTGLVWTNSSLIYKRS
jgi:hypothetical protein